MEICQTVIKDNAHSEMLINKIKEINQNISETENKYEDGNQRKSLRFDLDDTMDADEDQSIQNNKIRKSPPTQANTLQQHAANEKANRSSGASIIARQCVMLRHENMKKQKIIQNESN